MDDYTYNQIKEVLDFIYDVDIMLYHDWCSDLYDSETDEPIEEVWNDDTRNRMIESIEDHPNAARVRRSYYDDSDSVYY